MGAAISKSIYIINPKGDAPTYYTTEVFRRSGLPPAVTVADLAMPTVAAFVPDDFGISLCEECVEPIDFSRRPDFVALTGKVTQWARMRAVAAEFRARGICVIIGGPYASLSPDVVRPHCDILVRGEIEEIADRLFADLRKGDWKAEYIGTKPDLRHSPVPRWDLYPNQAALSGSVQTSRGCPFECEFCDVIEYLGRKQRHKQVPQVLAELDELYRHGYRYVFLADDNFTVYRARTKELLAELAEWNARQLDGPMQFATQVSVDAADDDELLRMCADAGLALVYIGIETPNEESLRIAKKRQNLRRDLAAEILRFVEHGICVEAGMVVGFDGDDAHIFERQYEFGMRCAVPVFALNALVAPEATPLFARLKKDGRLADVGEIASVATAGPWETNFAPLGMSRDELREGIRSLSRALYEPEAFEARVDRFLDRYGRMYRSRLAYRQPASPRRVDLAAVSLAFRVGELGRVEAAMVQRIFRRVEERPETGFGIISALTRYAQIRHMHQALMGPEVASPRSLATPRKPAVEPAANSVG